MANYDALTEEERTYIRDHCAEMTIGEMATALGRNYYTVLGETRRIGYHRFHLWTEEEDELLKSLWMDNYCAEYISQRMGIDANCIYNRIRRLRRNGKWTERKKE